MDCLVCLYRDVPFRQEESLFQVFTLFWVPILGVLNAALSCVLVLYLLSSLAHAHLIE